MAPDLLQLAELAGFKVRGDTVIGGTLTSRKINAPLERFAAFVRASALGRDSKYQTLLEEARAALEAAQRTALRYDAVRFLATGSGGKSARYDELKAANGMTAPEFDAFVDDVIKRRSVQP